MAGLTEAQRRMLEFYDERGPTAISGGRAATFNNLVQRGLLTRSYGPGVIEADISNAGRDVLYPIIRAALSPKQED